MSINEKSVKGVLLDISGVLVESCSTGVGSKPIEGSVEAVKKLQDAGFQVRLVTNESQKTRTKIHEMLTGHGFRIEETAIFPPAKAMATVATEKGLRPFLLVHPNCLADFDGISTEDPNCVVLGDAADGFSYRKLNKAFQTLIKTEGDLYSLGKGKYFKEDDKLVLDVGSFAACLEYASEREAIVVGKPSRDYFLTAVKDMGIEPQEVVMVGDDVVSDVGGAQKSGMRGVLVRTGKFRPSDENHPKIKPDQIVDNLSQFVDLLIVG